MAKKKQGKKNSRTAAAREVDRLLRRFSLAEATDEAVGRLASRIARLGAEAVRHLARSGLRPGADRREKVAAVLAKLEGRATEWALEELARVAQRGHHNPTERLWLLTILEGLTGEKPIHEVAGERREEALGDETQLLLWRDELASLPPSQQEALLEPILHTGDAKFLPLLSALLTLRQRRLDVAIAGALGRFPSAECLPLLRELLKRPDGEVRRKARQSLLALARQGVRTCEVFVASEAGEPPLDALLSSGDRGGSVLATVVSGRPPASFRYVVVLLDQIEAGIKGAWGESGLTEDELSGQLNELFEQTHGLLHRVPSEVVQSVIAEAEDFARAQGRELPPDYLVWRRCIGRPARRVPSPVVFGPKCGECGARMRRSDVERGGIVSGQVALCALCAAQPRTCSKCGRALSVLLDDFLVRADGTGSLEFMCGECGIEDELGP